MKLLASIVVALLFACSASAQWYEGQGKDRKLSQPETWQGSVGNLGAMVLITNDPEGFFEQWNKPPSPDRKPELSTVSKVKRGDVVMAIVVFSGCSADKSGNCNSKVDFKVINPDGSVYADISDGELWIEKPAIPKGFLQVSISNLGFEVEPDDQIGEYRIEVTVRDLVSELELGLLQTLVVEEASSNGT